MEKINRISLSENIVNQFLDMIMSGELKPNQKLPPERELCETLGVSRLPLREALAKLQAVGVISLYHGSGNYVNRIDTSLMLRYLTPILLAQGKTTFNQVMEVRRTIESRTVELAAQHRSKNDIKILEQLLEEMEGCINDIGEFIQRDMQFHLHITKAAGNVIFHAIMVSMYDLLIHSQRIVASLDKALQRALDYHKTLLSNIKKKNCSLARETIINHLDDIERSVNSNTSIKTIRRDSLKGESFR